MKTDRDPIKHNINDLMWAITYVDNARVCLEESDSDAFAIASLKKVISGSQRVIEMANVLLSEKMG